MPTVNIFHAESGVAQIESAISELRRFIAEQLTCGAIKLRPEEVSIRLIRVQSGSFMIAPIEIEITAHAFPERIQQQDEICLHIRTFLRRTMGAGQDVRVWLLLPQLGHSWEE